MTMDSLDLWAKSIRYPQAMSSDGSAPSFSLYRTDLGSEELKQLETTLSVDARMLLQAIDKPTPLRACLSSVPTAKLADVMLLLGNGWFKIATLQAGGHGAQALFIVLVNCIVTISNHELYTLITREAKHQLGLIGGLKIILALERSDG